MALPAVSTMSERALLTLERIGLREQLLVLELQRLGLRNAFLLDAARDRDVAENGDGGMWRVAVAAVERVGVDVDPAPLPRRRGEREEHARNGLARADGHHARGLVSGEPGTMLVAGSACDFRDVGCRRVVR
jgi:hypothetical protein